MQIPETPVRLGPATLAMADALALYRAKTEAWETTLVDGRHVEAVAVWNAIQFADKTAKGIPARLVTSPALAAAMSRLAAELLGVAAEREAA